MSLGTACSEFVGGAERAGLGTMFDMVAMDLEGARVPSHWWWTWQSLFGRSN